MATAAAARVSGAQSTIEALSTGSAYSAFLLIAVSLSLGPANVLRRRHNPVHNTLRRDFGITAGVASLVHTALGLQVHMGGEVLRYFTLEPKPTTAAIAFAAANWLGLGAAILFALLIAVSNNKSIRSFGLERWKRIQRWVYAAAAMTIAHGALYMVIEKRNPAVVAAVLIVISTVAVLQLRGARIKLGGENEATHPK